MGMEDDDLIRQAIRDYAYADPSTIGATALRRDALAARRRATFVRLATAAVVALLVGGVVAWVALARPAELPPVGPTPSPSATTLPSPTPTTSPSPAPTPTPPPSDGYAEQSRTSNGVPAGGVGDTLEGLTLTAVDITDAQCPGSTRCPGAGTLTVLNSTDQPIDAFVYFNVYRNNIPSVADAQTVSLAPGESTSVTINVQPGLADTVPPGATGSIYSWNFSVELQ